MREGDELPGEARRVFGKRGLKVRSYALSTVQAMEAGAQDTWCPHNPNGIVTAHSLPGLCPHRFPN